MLNRDRDEVISRIQYCLEEGLQSLTLEDGTWAENNMHQSPWNDVTDWTAKEWDADRSKNYSVPPEAAGWPPELTRYIRKVAMITAISIVDAIYTENEMQEKVDNILLEDSDVG